MNSQTIVMCVVALILGMLLANMLKNVCGCKTVIEGTANPPAPESDTIVGVGSCCSVFGEGCHFENTICDKRLAEEATPYRGDILKACGWSDATACDIGVCVPIGNTAPLLPPLVWPLGGGNWASGA